MASFSAVKLQRRTVNTFISVLITFFALSIECLLGFIPTTALTLLSVGHHSLLLPKSNTTFGLPRWLSVNNLPANAGDPRDVSSIPRLGGSPGEGNGNPLQYSGL